MAPGLLAVEKNWEGYCMFDTNLNQCLRGLVVNFLQGLNLVGFGYRKSGDNFSIEALDDNAKSCKHGYAAMLELCGTVPS